MYKKTYAALAAAALLLACTTASAQVGNGGGTYAGVDKANPQPARIVSQFVDTAQVLLAADATLLTALGAKDQADKVSADARALTPESSRSQLESAIKAQTDGGQAIEQKLGGKVELDDAARSQFGGGVSELARGLVQYSAMSADLVDLKKYVKPTGGAASSALYLSKALPGSSKEVAQTLKAAVAYARANNIPVSAEATAAAAQ